MIPALPCGLKVAAVLTTCETRPRVACDLNALGTDGPANRSLFIAGPLARGTVGDLMGLPQVTEHAVFVAREVEALLRTTRRPAKPAKVVGQGGG